MNIGCVFCRENRFTLNGKIGLDTREAVLYEDELIYATPDLSPLTAGHLLIVSQEHYNSFANAPRCVIDHLMKALLYFSEDIFGGREITWFEHGAVFERTGGASISHAHLHLIPQALELNAIVEKDRKYLKKIPFSDKGFADLAFAQPYLWIGNRRDSFLYHVKELPSQYLRKMVMQVENGNAYDWKENYSSDDSIKRYRSTIELVHDKRRRRYGDGTDYIPGLFWVRARREKPDFLLHESETALDQWLLGKLAGELEQLSKSKNLSETIQKTGKEAILSHAVNILMFVGGNDVPFLDKIINQEYSDLFRRIFMLILTGNSLSIYNNHKQFNELGRRIVPLILEKTRRYDFRDRLYQSIASGLIGMDIKEENISTAPVSLDSSFSLNQGSVSELSDQLERYIGNPNKIGIDCFSQYDSEVIKGRNKKIVWITDDYIQTVFELKLIEEQMRFNESLIFTLIPRYDSYANDASYDDVMGMLDFDILSLLHTYYRQKRFCVCRDGMDISTFDGYRLSEEAYAAIAEADIVVLSGARAYEMSQGMNKTVYYTGIAVCKGYTESITGFSKESGKLIFLRQDKGEHSFSEFAKRATRRMKTENGFIPVAGKTAREYYEEKYGKNETGQR